MTPYLLVIPLNIHVGFFQPMFSYSSPLAINFKKKEKKFIRVKSFFKKSGQLLAFWAGTYL
jgi:hypothetical protein